MFLYLSFRKKAVHWTAFPGSGAGERVRTVDLKVALYQLSYARLFLTPFCREGGDFSPSQFTVKDILEFARRGWREIKRQFAR